MRRITVAAIQLWLEKGDNNRNINYATNMIIKARNQGALLVVLPELFASGYFTTADIWDCAESINGSTVQWMKKIAGDLGIYLGAGMVETDGKDFFNIFVITGPGGEIKGKACKDNGEAYVFRRGKGSYIIDTEIGRIGVGICGDNQYFTLMKTMAENKVDLMLMPHAWPIPYRQSGPVDEITFNDLHNRVKALPALYAQSLGIPVVFVNQVGPMYKMPGLFGRFMSPDIFSLQGGSSVTDSDCRLLGMLESEEGMLVHEITLDPAKKRFREPARYGKNLFNGSVIGRRIIIPLDIMAGKIFYTLSRVRRRKARLTAE